MKRKTILPYLLLFVLILTQSCNTLYNTQIIDIEILEPAKAKLPYNCKNIAIRYNNCNVAYNPLFAKQYIESTEHIDQTNLDSIAALVYYQTFIDGLQKNNFFNTITEIQAQDFSDIKITDTLKLDFLKDTTLTIDIQENSGKISTSAFSEHLKRYEPSTKNKVENKFLDSDFNLYSKDEISQIADTVNADLLLSLDHFVSLNGITQTYYLPRTIEIVQIISFWSAYDLNEEKLKFYLTRNDTITWSEYSERLKVGLKLVPNRKDAVLNAADISGEKFANYLSPHWIQVKRMYYGSGHVELKLTEQLVEEGKWLEAAKIWKTNLDNKNKNIVAKCMFNLGVACEMNGNIEAAIEWVVKSYHIFGRKNEIHAEQCQQYIRILSHRKLDYEVLEKQFSWDSSE